MPFNCWSSSKVEVHECCLWGFTLKSSFSAVHALFVFSILGPFLGFPLQDVVVTVNAVAANSDTSLTMVSACVSRCMQKVQWKPNHLDGGIYTWKFVYCCVDLFN